MCICHTYMSYHQCKFMSSSRFGWSRWFVSPTARLEVCNVFDVRAALNPPFKASKPYVVENDDEDADDFIADLFSYLDVAKGELQKLAEEWERVNVNAINDLHRVKDKWRKQFAGPPCCTYCSGYFAVEGQKWFSSKPGSNVGKGCTAWQNPHQEDFTFQHSTLMLQGVAMAGTNEDEPNTWEEFWQGNWERVTLCSGCSAAKRWEEHGTCC